MDVIQSFNEELASLYETKPPITKAKITTITKLGIKAIKFYKHVVQSVEKFIAKCKPEYKIPALYIIDSLVRQSRHQFPGKDVFGPRFAKNICITFQHLYQCSSEDKSRIIRVLNLWQKNEVFSSDILHPLFEMADPKHPVHKELKDRMVRNWMDTVPKSGFSPNKFPMSGNSAKSSVGTTSKLGGDSRKLSNSDLVQQLQHLQNILQNQSSKDSPVKFDKKLLDFDYGEEDGEDETANQSTAAATAAASNALKSILSDPELLQKISKLQNQNQSQFNPIDFETLKREQELAIQEKEFDKHLAATLPGLRIAGMCDFKVDEHVSPPATAGSSSSSSFPKFNLQSSSAFPNLDLSVPPPGYSKKVSTDFDERVPFAQATQAPTISEEAKSNAAQVQQVIDLDDSSSDSSDKNSRKRARRSRSSSRDRSSRRHHGHRHRRSRSDSRSKSKRRRSRSDSRETTRRYFDKEKEADRRKKALPPFKKNHLAVCSTTLWIGHLSKLVQEEELSDTFGEFGDVVSINLIPPRGCAFVCMNRRQDAARALQKLKNSKLQGKMMTLSWAPGKGMKDREWKDFWEVQDGVSYIPYDLLNKDVDYDYLEDGGIFDEDTVPLWLKDHLKMLRKKQEDEAQNDSETPTVSSTKADAGSETLLQTGVSPLPDAPEPNTTNSVISTDKATTMNNISVLAATSASSVPQASTTTTGPISALAGSHLMFPPYGIPRLLTPMGMLMGGPPSGLMPTVPLGVPPPGLSMMHQQILNPMPPSSVNTFNQNVNAMLAPLPFGLQYSAQPTLQPDDATPSSSMNLDTNVTQEPEKKPVIGLTESRINVAGNGDVDNRPFNPLSGPFLSLPPMSMPPPSIVPPTPTKLPDLSVPPPAIVKNADQKDPDDDHEKAVVLEDTTSLLSKKPVNEMKDKDRDDQGERYNRRDKEKGRDRHYRSDRRDRTRDRSEEAREKEDRGSRWENRASRGWSSNRERDADRFREDRSFRRGHDVQSNRNDNEEKKIEPSTSWTKSTSTDNSTTSTEKDVISKEEHVNLLPPPSFPQFAAPPPSGPLGPKIFPGAGEMSVPPPFIRHPGPPPLMNARNDMETFRPRFDSLAASNREAKEVECFEGVPLENRFLPGVRRDLDNTTPDAMHGFRGPDGFIPRGPPPNFGPRGFPPDFLPRGLLPANRFPPRGMPFDGRFCPRGPPSPFGRPDVHSNFHDGPLGPRTLIGPDAFPRPRLSLPLPPPSGIPFNVREQSPSGFIMRLPPRGIGSFGMVPPLRGPPPFDAVESRAEFENRRGHQWKERAFDEANMNADNELGSQEKRCKLENEETKERDEINQVSSGTNPSKDKAVSESADGHASKDKENNFACAQTQRGPQMEPTRETDLPTQGPGEVSEPCESMTDKEEATPAPASVTTTAEEFICDSTVD